MGILESRLAQRARRSPVVRPPAIAAYRLIDRLLPAPAGPRVLANSMPKSGTHLLTSLLEALPRLRFAGQVVSYLGRDAVGERDEYTHFMRRVSLLRDSHYIAGHLTYDPAVESAIVTHGIRMVTIVRDPRAHLVSWANYLLATRHVPGREWVSENYPDTATLLPAMVRGIGVPGVYPYLPDVGERFRRYTGWVESSAGIVVRFEDLVGARGGGDDERQDDTTGRIVQYLGYPDAAALASEATKKIFSTNSATFRTGQIDSWRDELPEDLAEETYDRCGTLMETWGYAR